MSNWIKNPKKERDGEHIGGGFFVFRRGDGTKRIRPSNWPFEHPTHDAAKREAEKLAEAFPGYVFDVLKVVDVSYRAEAPEPPAARNEGAQT